MTLTQARATTANPGPTATVRVSDKDALDVWAVGDGTPVVLVHGALLWYLLEPLAEALSKTGKYRVIWFHRRGYAGKPTQPVDLPDQARDVVAILDALEIGKAHVVGHSAGGPFVLELAMQAPQRLHSAALFDFSLANQVESGPMLEAAMTPLFEKIHAGDLEGAATDFLAAFGGSKDLFERALPGSWSAVVEDAATWFGVDLPALAKWTPDPERIKAIDVPLAWLAVSEFPPIRETEVLLKKLQPELTVLELSSGSHFFPLTATAEAAAMLHDWLGQLPAPDYSSAQGS